MLETLELQNLKSCKQLRVRLAPLVVLSGLNSSGKSSVLQSIALIRQSYSRPPGSGGLTLNGEWTSLGAGKDVLSENADSEEVGISFVEDGKPYQWQCKCSPDVNVLPFSREPRVLPLFLQHPFQYLRADRITPATMYPSAPQHIRDAGELGVGGEYTVDFLARNRALEVPVARRVKQNISAIRTTTLFDQAAAWLQHLSPGVLFGVEQLGGTDVVRLSFRYSGKRRDVTSTEYRPTNVGFGLTYSLPILVACLSTKPGGVLLLENPEAHLHPRGQSAMGTLLAQCSSDNVQIIVETHSDHLLNGVRLAVKHGIVKPDAVVLHYFSRQLDTGDATVQSPTIQSNGRLSFWPEGFFDQWEKTLDELLD
ncbi:MAG: DUF3696 domain-containing protein [Betaproteobacteria bacterium]